MFKLSKLFKQKNYNFCLTICGPHKSQSSGQQTQEKRQFCLSSQQNNTTHNQRYRYWRKAITQNADGLEKRATKKRKNTNSKAYAHRYFTWAYILPPSSFEFSVTIAAPIHTITNTCANSGPPSYMLSAEPCSIVAIKVQSTSGPHKSPKILKHKVIVVNKLLINAST